MSTVIGRSLEIVAKFLLIIMWVYDLAAFGYCCSVGASWFGTRLFLKLLGVCAGGALSPLMPIITVFYDPALALRLFLAVWVIPIALVVLWMYVASLAGRYVEVNAPN